MPHVLRQLFAIYKSTNPQKNVIWENLAEFHIILRLMRYNVSAETLH